MDKLQVRQAVAHALNRQEVVDTFYAEAEVATRSCRRRSSATPRT